MKTKEQKRLEAIQRLERAYPNVFRATPERIIEIRDRRQAEAARLRTQFGFAPPKKVQP